MQLPPLMDIYQMSVGSMIYCLEDIKVQLPQLPGENQTLQKRIKTAITSSTSARSVRFRWNVQNQTNSKGRGRAFETDNAIDKTLSAMHDQLVAPERPAPQK